MSNIIMKRVGAKPKSIPEKGQSHESTPETKLWIGPEQN